jgi:hypothetical protein
MVDERFSAAKFTEYGVDSEEAEQLAKLLGDEIQVEMHEVIQVKFNEIIERLNKMGHNLKSEYPPIPGDISFRDDWVDKDGYHCKLRVGFDTVVSTGYAHLINPSEGNTLHDGNE